MNTLPQYEADDGPLSPAQIKQLTDKLGMNKLIKELADRSKMDRELRPDISREHVWIATDKELEEFAQMIAKECLKIVQYEANGYAEPVWAFEIVNDILEQFDMSSHLE